MKINDYRAKLLFSSLHSLEFEENRTTTTFSLFLLFLLCYYHVTLLLLCDVLCFTGVNLNKWNNKTPSTFYVFQTFLSPSLSRGTIFSTQLRKAQKAPGVRITTLQVKATAQNNINTTASISSNRAVKGPCLRQEKICMKSWANVSSKDLKNVKMQSFQRIKNLLYVQRELCCTDGDGALEVGKETRNTEKRGFLSLKFVCCCSSFLFCSGFIHSMS